MLIYGHIRSFITHTKRNIVCQSKTKILLCIEPMNIWFIFKVNHKTFYKIFKWRDKVNDVFNPDKMFHSFADANTIGYEKLTLQ